ncbi:phage protein Gp27 family protein [Chitiniphilus shinanonensis]|uniref:phage protein Gp27 family protein n=1 Tax=Chitiniphilus shinanonensis TaxID=553088 RepID=UPI0030311214
MARKSSIERLPAEVKQYIEKLLREDRLTLDELLADIRTRFPAVESPSRSSLHRYRANFDELTGRMREIETAAGALVSELGEGIGDKAGALLTQAVTTLATDAALRMHDQAGEDGVSVKEIAELARAARAAMQARTMSLKERQQIEQLAREKLVREQREKLDELGRAGEVDAETLNKVIRAAYGL